jgi:3-deoxy-manno-octulosonate cytidylyltransferase (CMP-KDO synthetase)
MIQNVWEAAQVSRRLGDVMVATDSEAVARVVEGFGGRSVMTPDHFTSGTDRVAHVARGARASIVVNLQADEPLLRAEAIDRLVEALEADPGFGMATLAVKRHDPRELTDPNVVKLVQSHDGEALYFSREALRSGTDGFFFKHIGIYAYRREALLRLCELPPSDLERTERLEQLRALQNGIRIKVVTIAEDTIAVDCPGDVAKVERRLQELSGDGPGRER